MFVVLCIQCGSFWLLCLCCIVFLGKICCLEAESFPVLCAYRSSWIIEPYGDIVCCVCCSHCCLCLCAMFCVAFVFAVLFVVIVLVSDFVCLFAGGGIVVDVECRVMDGEWIVNLRKYGGWNLWHYSLPKYVCIVVQCCHVLILWHGYCGLLDNVECRVSEGWVNCVWCCDEREIVMFDSHRLPFCRNVILWMFWYWQGQTYLWKMWVTDRYSLSQICELIVVLLLTQLCLLIVFVVFVILWHGLCVDVISMLLWALLFYWVVRLLYCAILCLCFCTHTLRLFVCSNVWLSTDCFTWY